MSEIRTLTLADLRTNPALMKSGAEPGDTYTIDEDGTVNVNRIFNLENEEVELGVVLTEKMLEDQPVLKERGLEAGDRYLPDQDKFIKTGTDSGWEQFFYGYQETPGLTENIADILESWAPLGKFDLFTNGALIDYVSPEEAYGEGFSEADNETQRSMIRRAKERQLLDKYGRFFEPSQDSTARTIGQFTGAVADPTSFIPFLAPVRGASFGVQAARFGANVGMGGALGAGYSVTDDLAAGEDIDVEKALMSGALAAGGTAGLLGVSKGVSKLKDRSANKIVDEANQIIARNVAAGGERTSAVAAAQEEIMSRGGMSIERAMERTGRKVKIPGSQSSAQKIVNAAEDQTVSRFYSKGLDELFGSMSTRIGNISQPVLRRLRVFDFDTRVQTAKTLEKVRPFLESLSQLKGAQKENISMHLANGRFDEASNVMTPVMKKQFAEVRTVLKKLHTQMNKDGIKVGEIENYFPRQIKRNSYEKLLKHWGKDKTAKIESRLREEVAAKGYRGIDEIPNNRRDEIANQVVRGYKETLDPPKSRYQKKRAVEDVTPDILKFYSSPEEALQMYVRNSVNAIARAKFFNRGSLKEPWSGAYDKVSIGNTIRRERKNLSAKQEDELIDLIRTRMMGGEQTPGYKIGMLRDLGYMGTIANPISAITQLGDLGVSGALHGFRNTIASMFGTKNIKMIDIGLEDVAQEFADVRASSNMLRKLFKISGFRAIDRLGKETSMNASFRKNINLLKTEKGEKAFRAKWGKFYQDDIDQIIGEFKAAGKNNEITEGIKFHAFNELSDMQPITMLEMPQKYVDHPQGRILYALKTFTLKQIDVARRGVVQEWKAGNKATAIKNAGLLAGYLSAANVGTGAIKDILLGRDPGLDNVPDKALWALLGVYGFNQYGAEKYLKDGKLTEWAANTVAPAAPMIDAITGLTAESFKDDPNAGRYLRAIPLVGPVFYNWFGGGAEKYNERLRKEREK
jgi:hypothetical protein